MTTDPQLDRLIVDTFVPPAFRPAPSSPLEDLEAARSLVSSATYMGNKVDAAVEFPKVHKYAQPVEVSNQDLADDMRTVWEDRALMSRAISEHTERELAAQLHRATQAPQAWRHPSGNPLADLRDAIASVTRARRTVIVHPSRHVAIESALHLYAQVQVVASPACPEDTTYIVAAGNISLDPDGTLTQTIDGHTEPLDHRTVARITL